jgi:hypothetical protein
VEKGGISLQERLRGNFIGLVFLIQGNTTSYEKSQPETRYSS